MYKNILVPIAPDHQPEMTGSLQVARKLLSEGGKITVLTVIEAIPSYAAQQLPAGLVEDSMKAVDEALEAELAGARDVETVVVVGHAASTILDEATAREVDCIVIASHQPGLVDYFLGSTAGRVVRHAVCAVHVLR